MQAKAFPIKKMENFFIRYSKKAKFDTSEWLYSKRYTVRGKTVYDELNRKTLEVPFIPKYFYVLTFDYFFIDEENMIYLANRNTLEIVDIGQIKDEILSVSVSIDEKWCVIVSSTEMLVFDTYIDLKKSIEVHLDGFLGIEWTDYDIFAVLTKERIFFYNIELQKVAESSEGRYTGISWRSKYNIFACSTEECIRFIEPNGLEHGNPLRERCDQLAFFENEDLLATVTYKEEKALLRVFYMKNFHWYQKAERTLSGKLVSLEKNMILFRNEDELIRLFLFRERTHCGSEYYVVDNKSIMYTNFSQRIIPPPFFAVKAEFDEGIVDISSVRGGGIVLHPHKAVVFEIKDEKFIEKEVFHLGERFASVLSFKAFILLEKEDGFAVKFLRNGMKDIYIRRGTGEMLVENKVVSDVEDINVEKPVELVIGQLRLVARRHDSRVIKWYNFNEQLCLLLGDGVVIYDGKAIHRNVDLNREFEIFIDGRIFIYNGTTLTIVDGEQMESITSFLANEYGLVITTDKACEFRFGSKQSSCQVDPGLRLLCTADFKVIGETRHGTLETFTPRIYTLELVKKLLSLEMYEEAVDKCQRHAVSFDVFLDHQLDLKRFVGSCKNTHLISFFNEALERLKSFVFTLESERVKRLRKVFDLNVVIDQGADGEYFEKLMDNDHSIYVSSVAHLFGPEDSKDGGCASKTLKPTHPISDSLEALLCGRSSSMFFNEFLPALDLKKNFTFIIFLLVKLKRTDLALRVSRDNLKEGVNYMLTITNTNNVIHAAMGSFEESFVLDVLKICQKDASDFLALAHSWKDDFLRFKICDFLENRIDAFYYLSRMQLADVEEEYVQKHGLLEEALMYEVCGLSTKKQGFYYELCAKLSTPERALVLFKLAGNREKALEVATNNLFWREAIELHGNAEKRDFYELLVMNLIEAGRCHEAGQLIEKFLEDPERAFAEYVRARSMGDALRLCSDSKYLKKESRGYLRERLLALEDLKQSFMKYSQRLRTVEERAEDCLSETSFSYTENMRGSRSAKLRNRPGGRYEREFVLDRVRSIGLNLMDWRDKNEDLLAIFSKFEMEDCRKAHDKAFHELGDVFKTEIDLIFDGERKQLYDPNRPTVEKPDLSKWL